MQVVEKVGGEEMFRLIMVLCNVCYILLVITIYFIEFIDKYSSFSEKEIIVFFLSIVIPLFNILYIKLDLNQKIWDKFPFIYIKRRTIEEELIIKQLEGK